MQKMLDEITEAIEAQKNKLLAMGAKVATPFTEEDLMQPFDYPELMRDPEFLYEEGIFHGQLELLAILNRHIVSHES